MQLQSEQFASILPWLLTLVFGTFVYASWVRERRTERLSRQEEQRTQRAYAIQQEERKEAMEAARREKASEEARYEKYVREKKQEEEQVRAQAGAGSGGYIVVDLPDAKRSLFHDLLKGFEEYARLKGYGVSFSVDTTFHDRIAFKFTLTDPDVVVGSDRVRRDLKEYLERISQGDPLDDIPQVISIEEHEVLVATLKNRISFLQHSYNLAKNSAEVYEALIRRVHTQPFLPAPAPSVVVQNGGSYSAPVYSALNSPQAVVGNENTSKNSIRIAIGFKERKEQIAHLSGVLEKLAMEPPLPQRDDAIRNLENVKEELEEVDNPEPGRVSRWLERAKQAIQLGGLGFETVAAAKELFKLFGAG